jgi:hypothetical protein
VLPSGICSELTLPAQLASIAGMSSSVQSNEKDASILYPNIPVVLTSGHSEVVAQSGTHGFELLNKPCFIDALS